MTVTRRYVHSMTLVRDRHWLRVPVACCLCGRTYAEYSRREKPHQADPPDVRSHCLQVVVWPEGDLVEALKDNPPISDHPTWPFVQVLHDARLPIPAIPF